LKSQSQSRHTLYRLFGGTGELLYIGRTISPRLRLKQHEATKDWWDEVAFITLKKFGTLEELSDAEFTAINTENPKFNAAKELFGEFANLNFPEKENDK